MTLDELNGIPVETFATVLGPVFENAAWVAREAAALRPFGDVAALHRAMFDLVANAPEAQVLAFLSGHPDLAGPEARAGRMAAHSTAEQGALGLDAPDPSLAARLAAMNAAYRDRFGFPFLICVRRHTRASLMRQFGRRLDRDAETERAAALQEVFFITRLRVAALIAGAWSPRIDGGLSTHVLNTAIGQPARGVTVELFEQEESGLRLLRSAKTDADGRVPVGLIPDGEGPLRIGGYQLHFHVGAYFAGLGLTVADPPFYDVIPIRVALAEAEAHYHVPLLVSPWTYTTYRGS